MVADVRPVALLPIAPETPPDMNMPMSKKDRDYCRRMARALIAKVDTRAIYSMNSWGRRAERVYGGNVTTQEDIDIFLTDETYNSRNRVMWHANLLKPIVEQYRGAAMQDEYNASVKVVSHRSVTRKQLARAQMMLLHSASEFSADMKEIVSGMAPIGDSMAETMANFESMWDDPMQLALNHLLEKASEAAGCGLWASEDAWNLANWGIVINQMVDSGTFLHRRRIHPSEFIWDPSAKNFDLSDASFMGVCPSVPFAKICEAWNVGHKEKQAMADSIRIVSPTAWDGIAGGLNLRVFSMYWTDKDSKEIGYAMVDGVPTQVVMGDERLKVSRNDLIEPPEGVRDIFAGKKTRRADVETVMYCDMVPMEYLMQGDPSAKASDAADIVLDSGVYDLQPYNPYDARRVTLPFAVNVYALADGEVISPVRAIIDPDRFVSRVLGAMEAQMNMSGGQTTVVDLDLLKPGDTETTVDIRRKQGKTIGVHGGGRGIANILHTVDAGVGNSIYGMLQIVQSVQEMVRTITGVHGPMMGEDQKNLLVGVTSMLIRRGVTMQEPFHGGLSDNQRQMRQVLITAGKELYLQRPDVLMDLVTDEDILALLASREMSLERANVKVVRDNSENDRRAQANMWLDQLIQMGLIDKERYADLYNNSYPEDVSRSIREYAAELRQAEKAQQREQARQTMAAALAQEQMNIDADKRQLDQDRMKSADMLSKEMAKAQTGVMREDARAQAKADQTLLENELQGGQPMNTQNQ